MDRRQLLTSGLAAALAGEPAAAAEGCELPVPDSRFPNPDLANLYDVIARIGCGVEPSLSFLNSRWKSLEAWKKAARPLLRSLLHYDPNVPRVSAETLGTEQRDGFRIERVMIGGPEAYNIPGWVLVPAGGRGKLPGIVAIHCHSGRYVWGHEKMISHPGDAESLTKFREAAYGRPYAEALAKRGFVVLVIDGFYFGSRRLRPETMDAASAVPALRPRLAALAGMKQGSTEWLRAVDGICSESEHLTAKTIFSAGATWPGILAWDDRRSLDYLCSRPDVDANRIGCVGLSIGGLRTGHLIATDPRVRVACVVGWMTEFRYQLRNHLRSHTWMIYIPGLYAALDLPDAVGLHAPGALLVQQCSRDALYPMVAMKGSVDKLARIYAKAGIPEKFRGTFHDVPHSFNVAMQEEAFGWIEKWI
jgi:dienelactone hydrolase